MRLFDGHNVADFRRLAKRRLPWPVFDYIDGAADDELTRTRNTAAFGDADLGSRAPFDQLPEIIDAVGGQIKIICDGGVRRGTHVLKALAAGAFCVSGGRLYLYALAAAGQPGVERAIGILKDEIERAMKLLGVTRIDQLTPERLRWRGSRFSQTP